MTFTFQWALGSPAFLSAPKVAAVLPRTADKSSLQLPSTCSGLPDSSVVKNPPANAGDRDSIPGWGRSPV